MLTDRGAAFALAFGRPRGASGYATVVAELAERGRRLDAGACLVATGVSAAASGGGRAGGSSAPPLQGTFGVGGGRDRAFARTAGDLVRGLPRDLEGSGVPISNVSGILGTGTASGAGGGGGGAVVPPLVTLVGRGSRFFVDFLTFIAPAPGGGGGGPPPVYCTTGISEGPAVGGGMI